MSTKTQTDSTRKATHALPGWAAGLPPAELARVVRPKEAAKILGIARTTLWRHAKEGRLPPALKIGPRSRGWTLAALLAAQAEMAGGEGV